MRTLLNYISEKVLNPEVLSLTVVTPGKKIKTAFAIMLLALFFAPPPLEKLTYDFWANDRYKAFSQQINGTYNSSDYAADSHESKLSFRIIPSIIGRLSFSRDPQTQMIFLYVIQIIFGFLTILIILDGVYKLTMDWLYTRLITSGLMLMHLGSSFFYDVSFFLDGFAFFFMILAMFTPSAIFAAGLVFIGFWCDERALLGGIGVVLFRNYRSIPNVSLPGFLFSKNSFLFLIAAGSYVGIRFWLTYFRAFNIPLGSGAGVGLESIWLQRNNLAIAQMLTFEFYWLYLLPVLVFFFQKSKILAVLIFTYLVVSMALTGLVMDVMRSVNYLFPLVILGIIIYYGQEPRKRTNETALFFTILNLIIPNYRYFYYFYLVIPLPIKMLQLLLESR